MQKGQENQIDWKSLGDLRERFLSNDPQSAGNYWHSLEALNAYDLTFARRIGWKWLAVMEELKKRQWTPPANGLVLDWGCGTAIAARSWTEFWGESIQPSLLLWDQSELALHFAENKIKSSLPHLPVAVWDQKLPTMPFTLLISHVLNEISPEQAGQLLQLIIQAEAVIWVEPGTAEVSGRLGAVREELRQVLRVVAPCTHSEACGLRTSANHRHWCHFFAPTPASAYQDRFWSEFSQHLDIDLRSLPVSFLVLEKMNRQPARLQDPLQGTARVIGRERSYKGYSKVLACSAEGVEERTLLKRNSKDLFRLLKKQAFLATLPNSQNIH